MSSSPSYVEDLLATIREIGKAPVASAIKPSRLESVHVCHNASIFGPEVSVTPKGLKLINHYRGGYHYFTVA